MLTPSTKKGQALCRGLVNIVGQKTEWMVHRWEPWLWSSSWTAERASQGHGITNWETSRRCFYRVSGVQSFSVINSESECFVLFSIFYSDIPPHKGPPFCSQLQEKFSRRQAFQASWKQSPSSFHVPMTLQTQRDTQDNIDTLVVCMVLLWDDKLREGTTSYGIRIVFAIPTAWQAKKRKLSQANQHI